MKKVWRRKRKGRKRKAKAPRKYKSRSRSAAAKKGWRKRRMKARRRAGLSGMAKAGIRIGKRRRRKKNPYRYTRKRRRGRKRSRGRNPRRRRRYGRKRNPFSSTLATIKSELMNPRKLIGYAVAAGGGMFLCNGVGKYAAAYLVQFLPASVAGNETFLKYWVPVGGGALGIGVAALISKFLLKGKPELGRMLIFGAAVKAVADLLNPLVNQFVKPMLPPAAQPFFSLSGFGDWVSPGYMGDYVQPSYLGDYVQPGNLGYMGRGQHMGRYDYIPGELPVY